MAVSNWLSKFRPRLTRRLAIMVLAAAAVAGACVVVTTRYVFRAVFAEVVPGQVYRTPQPSQRRLRGYIAQYGIRTVISLRGNDASEVVAEMDVCRELGVVHKSIALATGDLPTPAQLHELIDDLLNSPRPILLHCRAGVDRTGLGAALAVLLIQKAGLDAAMKQLPLIRTNDEPDHVCDVLGQYRLYCSTNGKDPNAAETFLRWANEVYTGRRQEGTQVLWRLPK
jgi:protein tyrosine/serine phosphatase